MITDTRYSTTYCGVVDQYRISLAAIVEEFEDALADLVAGGIPAHATEHEYGESDPLIPANLGQYGVAELDSNGKVLTKQENLIRVAKTASWTLALTDADHKYFYCGTNAITVTIPPSTSVNFPIGVIIPFTCISTGSVTFAAGTGVTLYKLGGYYKLTEHPSTGCLMKLDTDMWLVTGCDA